MCQAMTNYNIDIEWIAQKTHMKQLIPLALSNRNIWAALTVLYCVWHYFKGIMFGHPHNHFVIRGIGLFFFK